MESRQLIAYLLIAALLTLAAVLLVRWRVREARRHRRKRKNTTHP